MRGSVSLEEGREESPHCPVRTRQEGSRLRAGQKILPDAGPASPLVLDCPAS